MDMTADAKNLESLVEGQAPGRAVRVFGLVFGPLAALAWIWLVPRGELSPEAHRLAAVMILTISWWLTEPIPIAATGLAAVTLAYFLGAVPGDPPDPKVVLAPFADRSVFFLLGGMFIARGMTRHGLDRRLALAILSSRWAARSPSQLILAVGVAVGFVSMWVSNTAATAMIYPVVMGMIGVLAARGGEGFVRSPFASSLLLMTAYASSIGGVATPIGTATNVVAMGFFSKPEFFGRPVDFVRWSIVGLPIAVLMLTFTARWLAWLGPARDLNLLSLRQYLLHERSQLGRWNIGEINTLLVLSAVVSFWVAPSVLDLAAPGDFARWFRARFPEELVALAAPALLFLLPVDFKNARATLEPSDFMAVDWGTMLLFGAGLSLGNLMFATGLAEWLGRGAIVWIGSVDPWAIATVAIVGGIVLSEFTSNAATAATLIPVIASLCKASNIDMMPALMGVTFAASFGSALPVSTPPNAIVYGSRLIPIRRMVIAGIGIDIMAMLVIWIVLRLAGLWGWTPVAPS